MGPLKRAWLLLPGLTVGLIAAASANPADARAPTGALPLVRAAASRITQSIIGGTPAVVAYPKHRTESAVIFVHGYGENQWSAFAAGRNADLMATLMRHGYTIAASDAFGNNWGDPRSQAAVGDVAAKLRSEGFTRLDVIAESMGGLDGLALIARAQISAWVGLSAVCNLRSMLDRTFKADIERVYGSGLNAALRADSPLIPKQAAGLPMLWFSSYGDTVVSRRENSNLCVSRLDAIGARARVVGTTGNHLAPSNFQPGVVLSLFA